MKLLEVPFLRTEAKDLHALNLLMAKLPLQSIDNSPWPEFKTTAKAGFSIAHNNSSILVRYEVEEEVLKSVSRDFNQNVHKDNCVEFFLSFGNNGSAYYNIELNCLGSLKIGYGQGRGQRLLLAPEFLEKVQVFSAINYAPNTGHSALKWQLLVCLPADVFAQDQITEFGDSKCKANFYKCGDDLPHPHFLSWNMIHAENPDFHRPEFFGELNFSTVKKTD